MACATNGARSPGTGHPGPGRVSLDQGRARLRGVGAGARLDRWPKLSACWANIWAIRAGKSGVGELNTGQPGRRGRPRRGPGPPRWAGGGRPAVVGRWRAARRDPARRPASARCDRRARPAGPASGEALAGMTIEVIVRGSVIPPEELTWRFSRSPGPGGQSVNTPDSRGELSPHLAGPAPPPPAPQPPAPRAPGGRGAATVV